MDVATIQNGALLSSAMKGLRRSRKWMESKWFYDDAGSALFEQITHLPEYYPTRTETAILRDNADRLAAFLPHGSALVELGSGASRKTRILLDAAPGLGAYVPVDISEGFLRETAARLADDYPDLVVVPVVGDFTGEVTLPRPIAERGKTIFFPGSTIGNLDQLDAVNLLKRMRGWEAVDAFILGVDLVKDPATLVRAYDDAAGVTAAFNLNLLERMNREIGALFNLSAFRHEARWNAAKERIEMHLVSLRDQVVPVGRADIAFSEGESIHTENSHKYTLDRIETMAAESGWSVSQFLRDEDHLFAVVVLTPEG